MRRFFQLPVQRGLLPLSPRILIYQQALKWLLVCLAPDQPRISTQIWQANCQTNPGELDKSPQNAVGSTG